MLEDKILRRNFLKALGIGLGATLIGCKKDGHIGPLEIVFIDEPEEKWENVDHVIDNSLEGGFSFDFRDLKGEGLEFGNLVELGEETHALNAQGYSFSSRFQDQEKSFLLTSLRKNKRGFVLDSMENASSLAFKRIDEKQNLVLGDKSYEIVLDDIILPEERSGFYIPSPIFTVNGNVMSLREGRGNVEDLFMHLKLKPYHEKGVIEVMLANHYFQSCNDSATDTQFTGLEHIIGGRNTLRKAVNANYYNGKIQEDAYFRINAFHDSERKVIILNAADKIRIPDANIRDYPSPLLASRFPTQHEVEVIADDKIKERTYYASKADGLEQSFLFVFSPTLEARISLPREGIALVPEFTNQEFEAEGKRYLLRYVAFDAGKIPKTSQPPSLGRFYYPITGFLTEILEEPQEVMLSLGEQKTLNIKGEDYNISFLKSVNRVLDMGHTHPDLFFEVEKNGVKEEGVVKVLTYGYLNRIMDINLDPNVTSHYGAWDGEINEVRFFVSKNKFSSSFDFAGDHQFSSLKKILIPDYNGSYKVLRPMNPGVDDSHYVEIVGAGHTLYQQVTLANRFNGEIISDSFNTKDYGFRVEAEFGLDSYEGSKRKPESDAYIVNPTRGFNYSDQIKNGYILRIKSIERISRRIIF